VAAAKATVLGLTDMKKQPLQVQSLQSIHNGEG
jgi:hypothetical protein